MYCSASNGLQQTPIVPHKHLRLLCILQAHQKLIYRYLNETQEYNPHLLPMTDKRAAVVQTLVIPIHPLPEIFVLL